jgi:hypothetical protein
MSCTAPLRICLILKQNNVHVVAEISSKSDLHYIPGYEKEEESSNSSAGKRFVWKPPNLHYLRTDVPPPPSSVTSRPVAIAPPGPATVLFGPRGSGSAVDFRKAPVGGRAVCTVQTFRNAMSGPMLFMFIKHHLAAGWTVIIFDRYGWHQEVVREFLDADAAVVYYPFTLLQHYFPDRYNLESSKLQVRNS